MKVGILGLVNRSAVILARSRSMRLTFETWWRTIIKSNLILLRLVFPPNSYSLGLTVLSPCQSSSTLRLLLWPPSIIEVFKAVHFPSDLPVLKMEVLMQIRPWGWLYKKAEIATWKFIIHCIFLDFKGAHWDRNDYINFSAYSSIIDCIMVDW